MRVGIVGGGALIGGMLLEDAIDDHDDRIEEQAYDQGVYYPEYIHLINSHLSFFRLRKWRDGQLRWRRRGLVIDFTTSLLYGAPKQAVLATPLIFCVYI